MDLSKQYNDFAKKFSDVHDMGENSNRENREAFYRHIDFITPGTKVLDVACGDGFDLLHYRELGAEVAGIDASEALIAIAKERLPGADIQVAMFENLPFEDGVFDAVLSKYAIQTSADMTPAFKEIQRVLKPGGTMLYLVTHPFRQYFEKKDPHADYFEQKVVEAEILNGAVVVKEPSHTMGEYLNDFLFKNFEVLAFDERWDAAAEQVDGRKYPGYLILKARKR